MTNSKNNNKYSYYGSSLKKTSNNAQQIKGSKKHRKLKIAGLIVSGLVVILIALGAFYGWSLNNLLNKIKVSNLTASVGQTQNILVAGSTTRCGLAYQSSQWGTCSQVGADVNSDIIMIVHLDPKTHQVSLLSIPRDTFVPNARSGNQSFKIDAALYQGPSQLVNAIQQDFGIPIQHYVEVNFDGFVNTVNAIGGIKMDFPLPVYDAYSHLDITTPGCKLLTGITALQLIRARHLQYKPASITTNDTYYWPYEIQSDIGRIARTHEFLRVLASTILAKGLGNPLTDNQILSSVLPNLTVDSGLTDPTLLNLVSEFHNANIVNAPEYTLPIVTPPFGPYYFDGSDFGDVVFPVEPTDQTIIDKFLNEPSNVDTMTGKVLPAASSITVNVMNGSGQISQATTVAQDLTSLGFNASDSGYLSPVSSQGQETYVYYHTGQEAQAEAVAHQLTGYVVLATNNQQYAGNNNVTVITGTSTAVTSSNNSTSTNQSATSSNVNVTSANPSNGYSAPTNANQGLTAWDPRACSN